MADERKIVIEIKNTGGDGDGNGIPQAGSNDAKSNQDIKNIINTLAHPIRTAEIHTVGRNVLVNQAYQQAKQTIKNVGQYHIQKYFTLHENYMAETDKNNILAGISKTTSFVGAVASGAMLGSAVPGVGTAIGAATAAVGWIANQAVEASSVRFQEQLQIATTNYQTQFQQTRIGLIDGRGGTNQ